ncbi:hypothetical protein [Luteolibacter sp. Populi]|uniref:hypothetical protein n=1 Tax=Luteolibacter sp. Populi TaxID=3230487 RepID=UPI003465C210
MFRLKTTPVVFALLALSLCSLWLWKSFRPADTSTGTSSAPQAPVRSAAPAPDMLAPALEVFRAKPTPEASRRELGELRLELAALPKDEAVARTRGFLKGGEDYPTGLSFEIGKDGKLGQWPTFRSFLLDTLLAIDPAAAAAIGREILATPTTADEWALALRNVARGEEQTDAAFLKAKTEELISNPGWQAKPSIGYLNAFDVLVHVGATDSTPLLSGLIQRKDRKDLAHAGFLTLDRLVQRHPAEELALLAADRTLQQSRPEMVAQQFARADLRDPAQQAVVKGWMLDPARSAAELRSFTSVYPNNNRFVSNNLLTREISNPAAELAVHDREVLEVITAWAADPAFAPVKDPLGVMISRLNGFTGSRAASPSSSQ